MRHLFTRLQTFINAKEIPEVTNFLSSNHHFHKFVHKAEFMKMKFWQKLDEAAFPEEHKRKLIERRNKTHNK